MSPHAGTSALRAGRWSEKGRCYLVTTTTAGRRRFFDRPEAAQIVLDCLAWLEEHERIRRLSAVVMPDHLHAVIELGTASLPSVMHSLKGFTAKGVNAVEARSGPVWQRQYHETALRDGSAVREAIRYCLLNPVRWGLTTAPGEFPFCFCAYPIDSL
ncbi:MAG: transposase [Acidobacteriia bacterium]|nr:transposase [Terriglobia bacterium]